MLWRVRTNLPDRPGTLAGLARTCGEAGVDIRRIQVFPGSTVGPVTDELVLEASDGLDEAAITALVVGAGGDRVLALPCTEAALDDQPTRYVEAARAVIAQPASFPDVVARLFDAAADVDGGPADVMELRVGDVRVQVRRPAPFTPTERERGLAMAALVSDVLGRERSNGASRRIGAGATVTYAALETAVQARVDEVVVGEARLLPVSLDAPGTREVDLDVDVSWQRRGIGTRLLGDVARLARRIGAEELLVRTRADNQAVMPMVLSAGMRGRIRMAGDELTVRIPLRDVRPLAG
ncbi:GNAT family N-acetyltransferase [Nocardioides sp. AX2bis]|uniref:GNAT family N-acetyltransferase n=1 Tax=Nocardioides sp. AX2bis TaxID=2653157 RepID=UPI0012EF224B|nr:GNAT family N-acetyltransferase [Nocardioides sp. AX2bis]VXB01562.1 GNAT family N-acetyltransferase [Nocardioides sp. AX2bis]